ncbi:uncharacterized protein LOC131248106 isoform X3 [Magnolia sinica]|uniref:uncharacterized protein LOC131248106 isoform X3 n=1 Tax=Magnolia sinica TaxID=86752 RepID=UPI00265B179F|nr:uncharacterized protein LOC131248106 isoform X3 [Magnolia sinica]
MEGLIKGLIDVALGNNDHDDDDRRHQHTHNNDSPSLDERSRSTWAQVVSGEEKQEEEGGAHDYNRNPWNREEEDAGRNNQDWETVGNQPPRKPHVEEDTGRNNQGWETDRNRPSRRPHVEEGAGRNDEGWETIGSRPARRPHVASMGHWHGYKQPPSEQEYSTEVDYGANIEPSEEELADLSKACEKLWELDSNRLVPGKDYEIDCGEGKKAYQKEDMAQGRLFSWLSEDIFNRPTYSRFCSLLDNYNPNEGCKEVVTSEEKQEQAAFMEEISRTAPIKYLHKYLVAKGMVSRQYEDFKRMMMDLWFDLYSRGGTSSCSSAFEHVFVGEIKQRGEHEVSGFHNWIQFYLEETKGRVDYQGYIFPRRRGQTPDSETQLLTIQFEWNGVLKSLSSTLVGVSPEFEIALYTLCFYVGEEDNHIQLGPYPVNIKCYRMGRDKIGSAFPISEC